MHALMMITHFYTTEVRAGIPPNTDMVPGKIYDVDIFVPSGVLPTLMKVGDRSNIVQVSRLGNLRCMKVVFKCDVLSF